MQITPMQGVVLGSIQTFLLQETARLQESGVSSERICIDPGYGFGKTVAQNFELLAHQQDIADLGFALLAGWSRKSSLGAVTGLAVHERLIPSVAAALLVVERGARVVRVHDVKETAQALQVWQAMHGQK